MAVISVLNSTQTENLVRSAIGRSNPDMDALESGIMETIDTEGSVYAVGLTESNVNSFRTRMNRKGIKIVVRKVRANGEVGHLFTGKRV